MFEEVELVHVAKMCARDYAMVREGERVLIWTDRSGGVDQRVIYALASEGENEGGQVSVIATPCGENRLGAGIPKPLEGAMRSSDVLISVLQLENAATIDNWRLQRLFYSTNLRSVAVICPTVELMLSDWARFPQEVLWAIIEAVIKQVRRSGTKRFRITDQNGTDLTGGMAFTRGFGEYKLKRPLKWQFFPGADMAEHPESPVDGVVVFEAMEGFPGRLREPIKLTVKDHWVTKVEGGEESRWLERMMKRFANGNYFSEVAIGANPKSPITRGLQERAIDTMVFRHSGTVHYALGNGGGLTSFEEPNSPWHWDGGALKPTMLFGDTVVIDEGRLTALDLTEVRQAAAKYGDPDDLLMESP